MCKEKKLHLNKLMGISHVLNTLGNYCTSVYQKLHPNSKSVWLKLPLKKETPLPLCRQLQNNLNFNSMKTLQDRFKDRLV